MTRLALVLGLLCLLVPTSVLARGQGRAAARDTSIFYYPWYGTPRFDGGYLHWNQNGHVPPLDLASSYYPARGPYSSADPKVVAAQMRDIAGAGMKEIVSSWWGWGSIEDQRLPMIVRMATGQGLQVAVQIEPYDGRTAQSVASDFTHLHQLGITRFYVYHPFTIDESDWAPVLQAAGFQVLAQTANVARAQAAHFAGVYTYDIATFGASSLGSFCARAHKAGLLCAPSVGPGYNALRANGDTRMRGRNAGATYDAMWKAAIQAGADRVTITSYNEWHEGTQIEAAMTPVSRRLTIAHGPTSTPVTAPYASYDGAYGLHGKAASRAYLDRTAYWTNLYRSGAAQPTSAKTPAQRRKPAAGAEPGRMTCVTNRLCSSQWAFSLKGDVHGARGHMTLSNGPFVPRISPGRAMPSAGKACIGGKLDVHQGGDRL
jgi:glycoprotein endo-alpha-1,2-mannosidase